MTGPEITDELVKVLRKRLDEATLDIITVMLVRNCKLTPADVEVMIDFLCGLSLPCFHLFVFFGSVLIVLTDNCPPHFFIWSKVVLVVPV